MSRGAGRRPLRVGVDEGLPVGVVDGARAAKGSETSFLRTVCDAFADKQFVWAAGPRHDPGGLICRPGGAVSVDVPVARHCRSVGSHSHPSKAKKKKKSQ